jgi:hypothetical protein
MKKSTLLLAALSIMFFTTISLQLNAQPPEWVWAKSAGSNSFDYGMSVANDGLGNTFVTGQFSGNMSFDPNHSVSSAGSADIYLVKYDQYGNVSWAESFGGSEGDYANAIAVDFFGNITIAGYFKSSSLVFGSTTLTNAGGNTHDIYIARFDANGINMWAKSAGGTGDDRAHAVVTDESGYTTLTGYFVSSTITFGAFPLVNTGAGDIFVTRYEPDGSVTWAASAIGTGFDYPRAIALDRSGNCYISGDFNSGSLTFGPFVLTKNSNNDIFVTKLSSEGVPLWAAQAGENGDNSALAVAVDTLENVYIAGSFKSSPLNFGTISLTNSGFIDIFLAKFNSSGVPVWAIAAGGTEEDAARALTVDKSQDVYLTGYFKSPEISFGTTTLTNVSTGTSDLFVTEFTPDGQVFWTKSVGGTSDDVPYSIAVDEGYNFSIAGYFGSPTLSFGSTTLTCNGTVDMFVAKSNNLIPSGINEPGSFGITVFPNPSAGSITITHPRNATVEIWNVKGQVVVSQNTAGEKSNIAIGNLSDGIYFIKVTTREGFTMSKLLKQ